MDFAQNWMVLYHEEVQSAFYAKDAVTVHPAVIHLRNEDGNVYTDSLCVVSDDKTHDAGAILAILDVTTSYLKKKHPEVQVVHYVSRLPQQPVQKHFDVLGHLPPQGTLWTRLYMVVLQGRTRERPLRWGGGSSQT